MGKGKVSKILCIMLSLMLVIGMAPANSSYAASRGLGNTISSWFNSIKGNSNNKGSSSTDKVTNTTTTLESTTQSDSSGSVDDIKLTKNATEKQVDKDGNQLVDITLGVKGKKVTQGAPLDITLVVDLSNSMDDNSRLTITRSAAKEFIETVLPASGTSNVRVSIVAYGKYGYAYNFNTSKWDKYGSTSTSQYYTSSRDSAKGVIDSNSFKPGGISDDSGGTNTEAGFRTAKAVTETRNRADATSVVVFMTDGVPTYRCNGTGVSGSGSSTADADFNQAVTAANELKNAGNDIYTVGLLTGYRNPSENLTMANKLLADDASYNIYTTETVEKECSRWNHRGHWNWVSTGLLQGYYTHKTSGTDCVQHDDGNWYYKETQTSSTKGYKNIGPAYSTKYYPITESAGAGDKIKEIYTNIANQILVLATGTVVDKIPEGFELTSESKTELVAAGYIVSEDGKTITFEGIPAGEEVKELTFTVKYTGVEYGSAYTNTEATYSGTLYDGTMFNKSFVKPVVGLNPKTENDDYYVNINEETPLDILVNDPSFNKKITDDGYTVSDFKIEIVENPANAEATVNGKNVDFSANTAGDYTFTYKVTATATAPDNYKGEGKSSYTLVSKVTTVTVHCINAPNKAYVIDFGKAVTFNDTFNDYEKTSTITLGNGSGTYGNLSLNGNGDSITYKLKKFMNGIDKFTINEKYSDKQSVDKTVSMIPATSIYYDDSFTSGEGSDVGQGEGIVYSGNWKVEKVSKLFQDSTQGGNYGYDSTYLNQIGNSDGTIHYVDRTEADNVTPRTKSVTASIKFKGTGIDIYSHTDTTTRSITVRLYQGDTLKSTQIIDQVYQTDNEKLYQIPVVSFKDLSNDTYTVKITASKNTSYYLDGLRIYNPIGSKDEDYNEAQDQYDKDNEKDATTLYLRDAILNKGKDIVTKVEGSVYIDKYTNTQGQIIDGHIMDVDSTKINTTDMEEYVKYGCKPSEVYLPAGKSITMTFDKVYSNVQLGLKTSKQGAKYTINKSNDIDLTSSTDMYYKATVNDDGTVTITNTGNVMIEITSIKVVPNKTSN